MPPDAPVPVTASADSLGQLLERAAAGTDDEMVARWLRALAFGEHISSSDHEARERRAS
jgi:hypothetical protein